MEKNKVIPKNKKGSETALKILDSLLRDSGQKKINENQIIVILDALANADDAEVVARFPVVLAICARRRLPLNSQALFSRYWEASPKRQNLEKLLLVSADIFKHQGLEPPGNLNKIAASLKTKFGDILEAGKFQLSSGMNIAIQTMENTLVRYLAGYLNYQAHQDSTQPIQSNALEVYLDRLFSPKQKELVYKKRDGKALTKTEREYYSRIVRKKLEAIASDEMTQIAKSLMTKTKGRNQ